MNVQRFLLWISMCFIFTDITFASCPIGCICFQRSVRCVRANLNNIPKIPLDTVVLDLRHNYFNEIPTHALSGLTKLTTLFLTYNNIRLIHNGAFDDLIALRYLYLGDNEIKELPENIFDQLLQLEAINLENNKISNLPEKLFKGLNNLNRLILFNNKIDHIPAGVFANLPKLRRLRLDGNPIICDCGVFTLWEKYRQQLQQIDIVLECNSPTKLQNRKFAALQENDFECRHQGNSQVHLSMYFSRGDSVELPCQMINHPEREIIWTHNMTQIRIDFSSKIKILPSGNLHINSIDDTNIGTYQCIKSNGIIEMKSGLIRIVLSNNHKNDVEYTNPNYHIYYESLDENHNQQQSVEAPRFIVIPQDVNIPSNEDRAMLVCLAAGYPKPSINWYFNDQFIDSSFSTFQIQTNGSLIIMDPTIDIIGTYRCEATNRLGTAQATAKVDIKNVPEILVSPRNQTVKIDKSFLLECDADGDALPSISWEFNNKVLVTTPHIALANENTELFVENARESDAGVYTCIVENENGRIMLSATVSIEQPRGLPQFIIEPYDITAISGTTIEMPCKADDNDDLRITWRKDGRTIDPNIFLNEKYQVSSSGSLFIRNVTLIDNGRYECSIKNEYGRATSSARLTVRSNDDLAPGDRYVRIAFEKAATEIDLAINNTVNVLFTNSSQPEQNSSTKLNYGKLLRVFRFPTGEARQLARAAEIYERTLVNIRKHVLQGHNLTIDTDKYEFKDLLSPEHLQLVAQLSGCMEYRPVVECTDMCYHSKYRKIDGTCNNLKHPTWGASLTAFNRLIQPMYENGFSLPIGWIKNKTYSGYLKPSARLISNSLISTNEITTDETISHMVMQWGQFLDHDLDHAIPSVSSESWDGIDCKKSCEYAPPCYPIEVPPNDPRIKNRRCIDVVRSSSICGSGMTSVFFDKIQNREQINQPTSYIDASQVYGYSYEFSQELRNLTTDDGLLRVGVQFPNQKEMLPFAAPQDGIDCRRNLDENQMNCFVAGDVRANEQVGLLAMHTIWMREHNRIAIKLKDINPQWDGDTIYQEARKIVGAQMQHITFKHWLPLIIGEAGMSKLGNYHGYDPMINPTITNEFATVALRFGHSIINPILHRLNASFQPIPQGHLPLHKAFFAPWRIAYEGGVDPLMRGLISVGAKLKTPTQNVNAELTEKLFHTAHAVALDLAAINIQRGRDHGIPGYNAYRQICNLSVAKSFDELKYEITNREVLQSLKELYGHPDNIDVWVGGILEDQVDGGKVGPLFQCLLIDQFRRLRDGDRFYYENPSVFLPEQLQQIKQANLGRILCDNSDSIQEVTNNVFLIPDQQGGYKRCEDIPGINLYFWQECNSCNALPPIFDSYVPETYKQQKRQKRSLLEMSSKENHLHSLKMKINRNRVRDFHMIVSNFQSELNELNNRLRKLEESCINNARHNDNADFQSNDLQRIEQNNFYCLDKNNSTRINNEIWSQDVCTICKCFATQITCTKEICPKIVCEKNYQPVFVKDKCCPHCPEI